MKLEKVFDLRFLVPPALFITFFWLLSPDTLRWFAATSQGGSEILLSAGVLLGLGYLISSLVDYEIRLRFLTSEYYADSQKNDLRKEYKFWAKEFGDNRDALELASWFVLDDAGSEQVREQIHKRWQMGNAAFNAGVGVALSTLFALAVNAVNCGWWSLWTLSILCLAVTSVCLFFQSGLRNLRSVKAMDLLMLNKLRRKKPKSANPRTQISQDEVAGG